MKAFKTSPELKTYFIQSRNRLQEETAGRRLTDTDVLVAMKVEVDLMVEALNAKKARIAIQADNARVVFWPCSR